MSFYNIKKFVCETSGNSNFTFFEALEVEQEELVSMQKHFPEPVKEPILRHVSFSTVPRIDMLVDQVYTKFKDDFFPGDKVVVKQESGNRVQGIIKEKVVFNSRMDSEGVIRSPFISYRIALGKDKGEIDIENPSKIYRERNKFTKAYVKTFLKVSLARSSKLGSPWVIREDIAKKYKISLEWPRELKKFDTTGSINSNKKSSILNDSADGDHSEEALSESKNSSSIDTVMKSTRGFSHTIFENLKETPPAIDELYQKWCQHWYQILKRTTAYFEDLKSDDPARDKVLRLFKFTGVTITDKFDPNNTHFIITTRQFSLKENYPESDPFHYVQIKRIKVWHYEKCQRFFKSIKISNRRIYQIAKQEAIQKGINLIDSMAENGNNSASYISIAPAPQSKSSTNSEVKGQSKSKASTPVGENSADKSQNEQQPEKKSHKPQIVDDLLLPLQENLQRPSWKKLQDFETLPFNYDECPTSMSDVFEVWMFINMFHEAFIIDTFTFDDFLNALQWKDSKKKCPLLLEIFCSLLSGIINKDGQLDVTLPVDIETEIKNKERELKQKKKTIEKEREREKEKRVKRDQLVKLKDGRSGTVALNGVHDNGPEDSDSEMRNENDEEDYDEDDHEGNNNDAEHDNDDSDESYAEDEDEEINHNAYAVLNYKKISWRERCQKRDFKNGNWLIVLLGVFSITEFIPEFKPEIVKTYEILCPIDEMPTPDLLEKHFFEDLNPVRRVTILSILMNILLNGNIVRNHTDFVVEKAASLRREKFELQKEMKNKVESAHNANKDVLDTLRSIDVREIKQRIEDHELEMLKTEDEKEKFIESRNKGGRPVQNTLPPEPSALEKAVAAGHPEFLAILNTRTNLIKEVEDMKKQKNEIDKTLVELNSQRIRFLGKDRFWNRYWWFERNGLPNLGGGKDDDDDEGEAENDHDEDDDAELGDIKTEAKGYESDSEYDSETYLMGRVWIQGSNSIDSKRLIDGDGSNLKRKREEEGSDFLETELDWVYIDEVEDFDLLIASLNDRGIRERALKKELNDCKDRVISSFKARKRFLNGNELQVKLHQYIDDLKKGKGTSEKVETKPVKQEEQTLDADIDESEYKYVPSVNSEKDSDKDDEPATRSMRTRRSARRRREDDGEDIKEVTGGINTRSKRLRIETVDGYDANGNINEGPNGEDGRELDVVTSMVDKFQFPVSGDDSKLREGLITKALGKLKDVQQTIREENMVYWVNSSAIEKLGHSHYQGPKLAETRKAGRGRTRGGRTGASKFSRTNKKRGQH